MFCLKWTQVFLYIGNKSCVSSSSVQQSHYWVDCACSLCFSTSVCLDQFVWYWNLSLYIRHLVLNTLLSLEWGVVITLHKNNSHFLKTQHTVRCPGWFNREQTSDSSPRVQTTKFLPFPGDQWEIIMKHLNSDIVLLHRLQIKGIKLPCHKYNTEELCSLFTSHNRWLFFYAFSFEAGWIPVQNVAYSLSFTADRGLTCWIMLSQGWSEEKSPP